MKTNKSFSKRLRVTKNGKIVARTPGQNHFNAKASGNKRMQKGRMVGLEMTNTERSRYLSGLKA